MPASIVRDGFGIRRATVADAETIAALATRLFRESYGETHPEPELSRYLVRSFALDRVRAALEDRATTLLLAQDARGAPVGYAHLHEGDRMAPAELTVEVHSSHPVQVVRFYVDQRWHGLGVAQALMQACIREAVQQGGDLLWLAVWSQALRPQAFYRKMGFEVVGNTIFQFGERRDRDFLVARPLLARNAGGAT